MQQMAMPVDVEARGETRVARLTLPYLPPSKNVYDGWPNAWKHSAKRKWKRDIANKATEVGLPLGLREVGLGARLVFASRSRRDPQNYAQALWNWVPDALQEAGVLLDDREGCVQIGPNWGVEFAVDLRRIDKKKRQRTVITVAWRVE